MNMKLGPLLALLDSYHSKGLRRTSTQRMGLYHLGWGEVQQIETGSGTIKFEKMFNSWEISIERIRFWKARIR